MSQWRRTTKLEQTRDKLKRTDSLGDIGIGTPVGGGMYFRSWNSESFQVCFEIQQIQVTILQLGARVLHCLDLGKQL